MHIQTKLAHPSNYVSHRTRLPSSIQYLVVHYTAGNGDTAKDNAHYFSHSIVHTSAHYFVDAHEIWQSVPDTHIAWHCGTKHTYFHPNCRNANSMGIELCSYQDTLGMYQFHPQTLKNAIWLIRHLQARYAIHHSHILRHYDVTHKRCPLPFVVHPHRWQQFLASLQEESPMTIYHTLQEIPNWGKPTVQKLLQKGFLQGEGDTLDLEHHALRTLVINDRAGLYDR